MATSLISTVRRTRPHRDAASHGTRRALIKRAIGRRASRIEGIALILAILLASTPN
jgi:hypothetical protein